MARRVNDVDLVAFPETGHGCGSNGDSALFFLLHPVGGRTTIVGFTNLAVNTGVVQNTLGGGGFTSIDVGHDADVANLF